MNDLSPSSLWQNVLRDLRQIVTEAQFRTWFLPMRPGTFNERSAVIRVPNEYIRQWVSREYSAPLRNALERATGKSLNISFEIDQSLTPHPEGATLRGISGEALLNPEYTFDTFAAGECNSLALSAAMRVAAAADNTTNPLFIYGDHGQGKTHLLQAICHQMMKEGGAGVILYVPAEDFANEFIAAVRSRRIDPFRQICRNADVLIMDDIHFLERTTRCQEEFFHTFNALFNENKRIILSSTKPPDKLKKMEPRIISRFNSGLIANLDIPDFDTRMAVVNLKAQQCERVISPEIAEYISTMPIINIRELEGMALRLIGFCSLSGREMDMQLAKSLLDNKPADRSDIDAKTIFRCVEEFYGVQHTDMLSRTRARTIAFPRQVCMFLMRMMTDLSLVEIGQMLGGRDHTTVLYAIDKVSALEKKDSDFARDMARLRMDITGSGDVSDMSNSNDKIDE